MNTYSTYRQPVIARGGMVATSQPLAAQAGLFILREGGNAVDAAICAVLTRARWNSVEVSTASHVLFPSPSAEFDNTRSNGYTMMTIMTRSGGSAESMGTVRRGSLPGAASVGLARSRTAVISPPPEW